jgi:hypothetical protein
MKKYATEGERLAAIRAMRGVVATSHRVLDAQELLR